MLTLFSFRPYALLLSIVCLLTVACSTAAGLDIVKDGGTDYRIVVWEGESQSVVKAADLLQLYVFRATGARLPIEAVDSVDSLSPQQRIIVLGDNPYSRSLGIDLSQAVPDCFHVKTQGQNLLIVGNDDEGDPFSNSLFRSAGTYIGVSRVLQDQLGIQQYLPGPLWLHVPESDAWTFPETDQLFEPEFLQRKPSVSHIAFDPNPQRRNRRLREQQEFSRFNGAGQGMLGSVTHAVAYMMKPYVEDDKYVGKQEWVALYDGQRLVPNEFTHWYRFHLCTANPEVRQIAVDYVLDFFEKNPDHDVCPIGMTDGDRHCQCDLCTALDVPGIESKSDRYFDFAIDIANRVREQHPDKMIGFYVYAAYVDPPVRPVTIPENLYLEYVQNGTLYFSQQERQLTLERMRAWRKLSNNITFYTWPASHGFFSLPLNDPQWILEYLELLKEEDYFGVQAYVMGCYTARQPEGYLLTQMLWDMDQNPSDVLDRFYNDLYGDAAEAVRSYHETISMHVREVNEELILEKNLHDDAILKFEDRLLAYYEPLLETCRSTIDRAVKQVADDHLRTRRVDVLNKQFQLAEMMIRAIQIGRAMDAGKATEEELKELDQLRVAYHTFLSEHGNTDVMDVRDISYIPRYGRDDLQRYLYIPIDLDRVFQVPIARRPDSQWKDLGFRYQPPTQALDSELIVRLPEVWSFRTDPDDKGEAEGWATAPTDEHWQPIKTSQHWDFQGVDYKGVAWYATDLALPSSHDPGKKTWLLFHAVDGKAKVYIDGEQVGSQTGPIGQMWNQAWAIDVTEALKSGGNHRLAVRVEKHTKKGAAGIWKPIEVRQGGRD